MAHAPKPSNVYTVSKGPDASSIDITIHHPGLVSENLPLTTWGSSFVLANALSQIDIDKSLFASGGFQVLELGAGTGLVGLSASVLWQVDVVLTDLEGIVEGLAQNIAANANLLDQAGTTVICGSLDWNQPSQLKLHGSQQNMSSEHDKATVVLAADVIYDSEHPEMLEQAIFAWLKPGTSSRLIMAWPLRVAYLDAIRDMWERLEAGGLVSCQEGRSEASEDFEDETLIEWAVFKWKDP